MRKVNKVTLIEQTCVRYGVLTAAALTVFFLVMRVLGLAENVELRFLNAVIVVAMVILSIRHLKKVWPGRLDYLQGISCGTFSIMIGVAIFAVFVFTYLMFLEPGFMAKIKAEHSHGRFLNPYTAAVSIFLEGSFSGLIIAFCVMQYMKDSMLSHVEKSRHSPQPWEISPGTP